jgi:hypothetical protein
MELQFIDSRVGIQEPVVGRHWGVGQRTEFVVLQTISKVADLATELFAKKSAGGKNNRTAEIKISAEKPLSEVKKPVSGLKKSLSRTKSDFRQKTAPGTDKRPPRGNDAETTGNDRPSPKKDNPRGAGGDPPGKNRFPRGKNYRPGVEKHFPSQKADRSRKNRPLRKKSAASKKNRPAPAELQNARPPGPPSSPGHLLENNGRRDRGRRDRPPENFPAPSPRSSGPASIIINWGPWSAN